MVDDTLVVTDMELPSRSTANRAAYLAALDRFAKAGGQLLLTDRAVSLAQALGVLSAGPTVNRTDAGHVDFVGPLGDHPYEKGLIGKPSQTYYEVMLGYPSRNRAPNYGYSRTAWEAAGGVTVATVGDQGASTSPNTALGTIARGAGQVTVFGAILPQAIEALEKAETPHPFGLASYAVTITGGQVLDNILAFRGTGRTSLTPTLPHAPAGPQTPTVTPRATGGSPLAATGSPLLLPLAGLVLLVGVSFSRRLRRR